MVDLKEKSLFYLLLSLGFAVFIVALSYFGFYEAIEQKLLDVRFRIRGPIQTRSDIATVDIDVRALQEEGRFQDWTRDKHAQIIRFESEHGVKMLAFDIYFPEPSTALILASDLNLLDDTNIEIESVNALIRDYDRDMIDAMINAGNVYLAESFKPQDDEETGIKKRSQRQEEALEALRPFYQDFPDSPTSSIFSFYDIEPPIKDFITACKGAAFAQTVADNDGINRRFPLVGIYDGRLFPSIALLMACDYYGVSFQDVEVIPGEHVIIPIPPDTSGKNQSIRIPITKEGFMMVNWAGDWDEDYEHYPYSLLKEFREAEHANYVLSRIKSLIHQNPDLLKDPRTFWQSTVSLNLEPMELVRDAFSKIIMSSEVESFLLEDSLGITEVFFESRGIPMERVPHEMVEFFSEMRNNLQMEKLFLNQPELLYDSMLVELELAESSRLERNFYIIRNLIKTEGTAERQHPLFFYPSRTQFAHEGRLIVPFEFNNKMLFYGLTATGTHDLNPMPFSPRYPMVGLHTNVMNTILSGIFIQRAPKILEVIMMLALGIILGLIIPRLHPIQGVGLTIGLWGAYCVGNYFSFTKFGMWVDILGPSLMFVTGYVSITVYNYINEEKDKKFLYDTFKAYLAPELIDKMYEEKQTPQLGGDEGIRTAVFTDIQSFSTIAEQLGSPTKLVELLNEYLTAMTDILLDYQGTLDKYEGDAILAFFGAPIPMEDHAEKACLTALAMQKNLENLCNKWRSEGNKWPEMVKNMLMRIGINSGPIVTGNMGSKTRMSYTMMGDAVNVAARLENIGKQYGVFTLCSEETLALVRGNNLESRLLDSIRVVGKSEPVRMYELLGVRGELSSETIELCSTFKEAYDFYLKRDWGKALEIFKKSLPLEPYHNHPAAKTTPSKHFIKRCEEYLKSPPGEDWDGVYTATSK